MPEIKVLTPSVAVEDRTRDFRALDLSRLAGSRLRIGMLDNTKPNARQLLGYVEQQLAERGLSASSVTLAKGDSGSGAEHDVLDRLEREADIVITALAN